MQYSCSIMQYHAAILSVTFTVAGRIFQYMSSNSKVNKATIAGIYPHIQPTNACI